MLLSSYNGDAEDIIHQKKKKKRKEKSYFTHESCDTLKSSSLFIFVKISKLNIEHRAKFEIQILKNCPSWFTFFRQRKIFTLLFCRGRRRNIPRVTQAHSCSIAHQNDVPLAVAVVVFFQLPSKTKKHVRVWMHVVKRFSSSNFF